METIEANILTISKQVDRIKGIFVLSGNDGTGKTTLAHKINTLFVNGKLDYIAFERSDQLHESFKEKYFRKMT